MKRIGLSILLLFFVQISSWAQEENLQVEVIQKGKVIPMDNGIINLKSDAFAFEITSNNIEGFLIGATYDRGLYRSAIGEADLEVPWFNSFAIADENHNPNKELIISDEVPTYWFYKNAIEHRFDSAPKGNAEEWVGQRTIEVLNNLSSYETVPLSKFKDTVYVYFYSPVYDEQYNLTEAIILYHAALKFK
ncbi:hypothetical protein NWE55_14565 [Myroides albus]|uniref:hypothetical protein n=1 Tax=Myroides albus TaxID=2562892 RepID=UPI002158E20B|nr:hypothetical protein [Myroides albus]UVD79337.1 hypothetical protein NWE55_14565 [Myroides albus]